MNQLRIQLEESGAVCATPECGEKLTDWLLVDHRDDARRVVFASEVGMFVGLCRKGHGSEFPFAKVKEGDFTPQDVTVRTIGRYVSQKDCLHAKKLGQRIPAGHNVLTMQGILDGPVDVVMCMLCSGRFKYTPAPSILVPKSVNGGPEKKPFRLLP